jgi:predicted glutamine amidotransferase
MRPGPEQGFPALPPTTGGQNTHACANTAPGFTFQNRRLAQWVDPAPLRTSRGSDMTVTSMCRLFGFHSATRERVHDALVLERNSLRRQSLEHPDGWGIASWQDGELPEIARGLGAAHLDPEFERISSAVQARTVLAHLRLASVGAVKLDNAHPFTHGRWAFAHNGTLHAFDRHRSAIESLIAPRYGELMGGETDSERCFALFLTRLSSRADLAGPVSLADVQWALATTMDEVARITDVDVGNGKRSAMNFLVTDGDLLAATRRDRTLFFAAEADEGVPIPARPTTGTRVYALEVASEELQGPDVWHEVPQDGVIGIDQDLRFVETSLATLLQRTAGTLARTG